jgi:phage gpG-like protein
MKLKIKNKTNFSFGKAISELKNNQKQYLGRMSKDVVKEAKHRIEKSVFQAPRPLTQFTKDMRKKGKYWGNKYGEQYKTDSGVPLVHTGRLYKSIKAKDKGVQMIEYAKTHNDGWDSGGKYQQHIAAREFLVYDEKDAVSEAKEGFKKNKKIFKDEIEKSMKGKK